MRQKLRELIADLSVIGIEAKGRKFKLQMPVMQEYRFALSHRRPLCGSCQGFSDKDMNPGPGDKIPIPGEQQGRQPGGGGDGGEPGYEVHVDLDELEDFLFDDLELPDFLQKSLRQVVVEERGGRVGVTRHGVMSRLNRRATLRQRNRRVMGQVREGVDVPSGFVQDDLRFWRMSQRKREISNAVIIMMMDVSGSMQMEQKYLCRAFFWLLDMFVRSKYKHAEEVFIVHHSTAREVDQDQFFHTTESGGTRCSSAYNLAQEVIVERYPVDRWNIYAFHMSDGDNWEDDNDQAVVSAEQLCKVANLFGYGQVAGWNAGWFDASDVHWSTMYGILGELHKAYENMALVQIMTKDDVYPQFRQMLQGEKVKGGVS